MDVPESKVRKEVAEKRKSSGARRAEESKKAPKAKLSRGRTWVPWVMCTLGLLGVVWLVLFYVAGYRIPGMRELGNWNILVAMGLMASAFGVATMWE